MACSGGEVVQKWIWKEKKTKSAKYDKLYFQISCVNLHAFKVRGAKAQRKCSPKGLRNCREKNNFRSSYLKEEGGTQPVGKGMILDWKSCLLVHSFDLHCCIVSCKIIVNLGMLMVFEMF